MALNTPDGDLAGRRVLLVEDEMLIRMLIEDCLADLGCELVDQASSLDEALEKAGALAFDVAILDLNLDGQPTFPVAEALLERGIPFVFATGYGASAVPPPLQKVPILHKPFDQRDLERALRSAWSQ
jgi:CheY-like chemotaxis protein